MTFKNPELFFLIWLVIPLAIILFLGIRKRRKILAAFLGQETLAGSFLSVLPGYSEKRRVIKAATSVLIFVFLLMAAAGPEYGHTWQEYEAKGIEIILAVDCSRSMLAPDIQPTRLDRAKREIVDLLSMFEGDKVGIVAFSGTAFLQCPLTLDYSGFTLFLNALSPDYLPLGGTDFESAITTATESFDKNSGSEKAIILITDGEATSGDAMKAAKAAKEKGIKIFCIGVGGETAAPVPEEGGGFKKDGSGNLVLSRIDEATLKNISAETGGAYVRSVAGDMDLDIIYKKEIRGGMEQSVMKSGKRKILENRFQWPLFIAVLLWFSEIIVPSAGRVSLIAFIVMGSFMIRTEAHADTVYSLMKSAEKAYEKNDFERAVSDLTAAQVKEPRSSDIFYNLGNTYYKMGQYDAALKSYSGALDNSDEKNKARILFNLGNTKYRMGDYKGAIEEYEKTLKFDPDDSKAKDNIEFAKKMMQEQKEQKEQNQNQKQDYEKDKDKSMSGNDSSDKTKDGSDKMTDKDQNKKADSGSSEPDEKKEAGDNASGQQGSEKDSEKIGQDQNRLEEKESNMANQDQKNESGQDGRAGFQSEKKDDMKKGAESDMKLNRLQDKPGAAMIPSYKKRGIEKDW